MRVRRNNCKIADKCLFSSEVFAFCSSLLLKLCNRELKQPQDDGDKNITKESFSTNDESDNEYKIWKQVLNEHAQSLKSPTAGS